MSTLSFQDYVRERMLKRRHAELHAAPLEETPPARPETIRSALEDNLLLFFTGYARSASQILKDQDQRTKGNDAAMIDHLHYVKDLGLRSRSAHEAGDLARLVRSRADALKHLEQLRADQDGLLERMLDEQRKR